MAGGVAAGRAFSLIVAPVIFCCALLMAHKKTQLIGFFSGLLFASVGLFQNRMVYDPIGLLNTSIAAVFAAGAALVLWSVLAPETPEAARRRFLRAARQALAKIMAPQLGTGLPEFEIAITAALDEWQSHLRPDRSDDIAAFEEGVAFLGAGRELIRSREERGTSVGTAPDAFGFASEQHAKLLERECALLFAKHHKGVLRDAA
ncbi:MAG: FUSC family protein [Alphaproteobacteria bacterium]|nr:FUSC family protein [Alphaproteobacteria bacterium]